MAARGLWRGEVDGNYGLEAFIYLHYRLYVIVRVGNSHHA